MFNLLRKVLNATCFLVPAPVQYITWTLPLSNSFAEVQWDFQTTSTNPCHASTFIVEYRPKCDPSAEVRYTETSQMSATIEFEDMSPFKGYEVRVVGVNEAGRGQETTAMISSDVPCESG